MVILLNIQITLLNEIIRELKMSNINYEELNKISDNLDPNNFDVNDYEKVTDLCNGIHKALGSSDEEIEQCIFTRENLFVNRDKVITL